MVSVVCGLTRTHNRATSCCAQVDAAGWVACVVAAFLANTAESIVGATVQGRVAWLTNDVVNGLQITLAAALALALRLLAAA